MKHPLHLVFVLLLLAGCAPTLAPHAPYLPVLRQRGEAEARLASGLTGRELELQLGFQATDRLVLHTALLRHERPSTGKSFRSVDLGLGYYWKTTDSRWRLGLHGGLAYGKGESGRGFCFDCNGPSYQYSTRYSYGYVQPTALLNQDNFTLGLGVRLGQAHYYKMREFRTELLPDTTLTETRIHDGRNATFLQPMTQASFRVTSWLVLSAGGGVQFFMGKRRDYLDDMNPFVGQVGLHFLVSRRPTPAPQPQP